MNEISSTNDRIFDTLQSKSTGVPENNLNNIDNGKIVPIANDIALDENKGVVYAIPDSVDDNDASAAAIDIEAPPLNESPIEKEPELGKGAAAHETQPYYSDTDTGSDEEDVKNKEETAQKIQRSVTLPNDFKDAATAVPIESSQQSTGILKSDRKTEDRDSFKKRVLGLVRLIESERAKWLRVAIIGIFVGAIEFIPTILIAIIVEQRLNLYNEAVEKDGVGALVGYSLLFSMFCTFCSAALVVFVAPSAAGSGLPHIGSFLASGYASSALLNGKTLLVKLVGTVFSISSGLAIGREGPAIHIGAAAASVVYDFQLWASGKTKENGFNYDGEQRHSAAILGSAAGFASAFRSPLGGMLYVMEELATHYGMAEHKKLGAVTFFGTALATLTINGLIAILSSEGSVSFNSIVILGEGQSVLDGDTYRYHDLPIFVVIGFVCGLWTGITTYLSVQVFTFRKSKPIFQTNIWKIIDVTALAGLTALVFSILPLAMDKCYQKDYYRRYLAAGGDKGYSQYTCEYNECNELATMTLGGTEGVIRHMLSRDDERMHVPAMITMLMVYTFFAILVSGTTVPAGTFVPALLEGSLIGRIFGEVAIAIYPSSASHAGVYAMIGAAAALGGWTRTMLAIAVTICEISGDVSLTVPLIIAIIIARHTSEYVMHHSYTHALMEMGDLKHDPKPPKQWIDPKIVEEYRAAKKAENIAIAQGKKVKRRASVNLGAGVSLEDKQLMRRMKTTQFGL